MSHRDESANNNRDERAGDIPMIDSETHFKAEWDAKGHATEDSVYAWLDGALSPQDSALIEAHTSGCEACGAVVAEARGFIAASARILCVADYAPRHIVPGADVARSAARIVAFANAGSEATIEASTAPSESRTNDRKPKSGLRIPFALRIAAAIAVVIGGSLLVLRDGVRSPSSTLALPASVASSVPPKESTPTAAALPIKDAGVRAITPGSSPSERPRAMQRAKTVAERTTQELGERARRAAVAESLSVARRNSPQALPAVAIEATVPAANQVKLGFAVATVAVAEPVREITGRVVDARNAEPLSAVQIVIPGSTKNAVTDNAGRFVIRDISVSTQKVQFRRLGYAILEMDAARLSNMDQPLDVRMTASTVQLGQVVVTSVGGGGVPARRAREDEARVCSTADVEFARSDVPIVRRIVLQRVSKTFTQGVLHDWPRAGDVTAITFNSSDSRTLRGSATAADARIELNVSMRDAAWYVDIREFRGSNVRAANVKFLVSAGEIGCE